MKNKEEIRQEIYKLATKISDRPSDDSLLEIARELYEKSVLLKYENELAQQLIAKEDKKAITSKEVPVIPELQPVPIEKKAVAVDLFSSESTSSSVLAPPVSEKPALKEPKKKTSESVADKLQHKKITDLKASIGINEKFQFINQLFEGNMKEYNVAVDQINSFNTHAEAGSYISNLKGIYKWNEDEPATLNFLELVQRRFL